MKKTIAAFCVSLLLVGCGHNKPELVIEPVKFPEITFTESQFDCGPAPSPLASDEELRNMTDRDLFDKYTEAWLWGERCSKALEANKDYIGDILALRAELEARGLLK